MNIRDLVVVSPDREKTWALDSQNGWMKARKFPDLFEVMTRDEYEALIAKPTSQATTEREAIIQALEAQGSRVDRRKSTETLREELTATETADAAV